MSAAKTRPCERCGTMIPPERIEVLPETRLCVACSQAVGGAFDLTIVPENLAKAGSLKKNYGSFNVKKTRRPIRRKER
jgi:DksA/TraR C4-type zinc finger protein